MTENELKQVIKKEELENQMKVNKLKQIFDIKDKKNSHSNSLPQDRLLLFNSNSEANMRDRTADMKKGILLFPNFNSNNNFTENYNNHKPSKENDSFYTFNVNLKTSESNLSNNMNTIKNQFNINNNIGSINNNKLMPINFLDL